MKDKIYCLKRIAPSLAVILVVAACRDTAISSTDLTSESTVTSATTLEAASAFTATPEATVTFTATPEPPPTFTVTPSPSPTLTATPVPTATFTPTAVPQPDTSDPLFIESLRQHRDDPPPTIELVTPLAESEQYIQYEIAYTSDGLRITGVMNVPKRKDDSSLPVILLNHGYYNPGTYTPGTGTQREADYLAQHGYVTIASDYRGYAGSEGNFGGHFDPGWTYDILDLLDALPSLDFVDSERVGMWGHSTGGEIALRVITARDDVKATVLFGSMGADAADNFRLVQGWGGGHAVAQRYGSPEEAPEVWAKLSPITYLADIASPVSIHHGDLDREVPPELSARLWQAMQLTNLPGEYYTYPDQRHVFQGEAWTLAMERVLAFFDQYVKTQ